MDHPDVLEELFEPSLIEVGLVEEPKRGSHGILGDHIGGEGSISQTKRHRLLGSPKLVHPFTQPQQCLLDDFLFEMEDVATRKVRRNGRRA